MLKNLLPYLYIEDILVKVILKECIVYITPFSHIEESCVNTVFILYV